MTDRDDSTQSPAEHVRGQSFEEAEARCRARLRAYPTDAEALLVLGEAHFDRGDDLETIRLLRQSIYCRRDFFDAYARLARVYCALNLRGNAAEIYRNWLDLDPSNAEAKHMVAAARGDDAPQHCSDDYVATHFDEFAASFDKVLKNLRYRGPEIAGTALGSHVGSPAAQLDVLDAGCGTGLCGEKIRPWCRRLVGVDLSKQMLAQARRRNCYDELVESEICRFMDSRPAQFDAVLSIDVLIYFGALERVILAASRTLKPGGLLIATVEALLDDEQRLFRLESHGRFSHRESYIYRVLSQSGLRLLRLDQQMLRFELGDKVTGYCIAATKLANRLLADTAA